MWRAAVLATSLVACGGKTPLETCGLGGPVAFERPPAGIPCEGMGLFAIRDAGDWASRCNQPIAVDLARFALIGYFLEGGCKYSGCLAQVPFITDIERSGCRLEVITREIDPIELGVCDACVQPRDFVLVAQAHAEGVLVAE